MGLFRQLMVQLPDGKHGDERDYRLDYMVYSASNSLQEEEKLWDFPLFDVYKRMMLKKFDSWIEWNIVNGK